MKPIVSCCDDPSPKQVYRAARAYLDAGFSFIPISANGKKMPAFELLPKVPAKRPGEFRKSWGIFREQRPTPEQVRQWFLDENNHREYGLAILGGEISGNLEILDLDTLDIANPFLDMVESQAPDLLRRLVAVKTPRPGMHLYYRCSEIAGNQKLARIPLPDSEKPQPKTIIETKGEGGYVLAPPSPRYCHPRQKCYKFISKKDLTRVPTITIEEREILLETARSFDTWKSTISKERRERRKREGTQNVGSRPGDHFNARADWADILEPHGWTFVGDDGGETDYWCRPGKIEGVSATTNHGGCDLLYVFSTNAVPFESEECYDKFHAYALLNCDGNFSWAARKLGKQGYGQGTLRSRRSKSNKSPYAGRTLRSRRR